VDNKKIFLGLDIGTNSVGWAVTDDEYRLRKFKNDLMWGVHLFDEAQQSADRRAFRTARRRLDRRKQRIALLQEFFAPEIIKKDPTFFIRLKESALLPQDREHRNSSIFFNDDNYTDKEYFSQFPTIHHLITELMKNDNPHDVRLVYLACSYILAHRGHFLFEVEKDDIESIKKFAPIYAEFIDTLNNICDSIPFDDNISELEEILRLRCTVSEKEKRLTALWFAGKKPSRDLCEGLRFDLLIKLLSGGKTKLEELFINDEYKDLEVSSVCAASADFGDILDSLAGVVTPEQFSLLSAVKKLNDWSLLVNILKNSDSISHSKIKEYEAHKKDLEMLKGICRKYLNKTEYNSIFRDKEEKNKSYNSYINSPKNCSQEDFCKFVRTFIDKIKCEENDKQTLEYLKQKCADKTLCPKQVNTNNRVIPYQLYYHELKCILDNACIYLDFLNERDKYGTVADKILSIMEFRIPYYVGPLVNHSDNPNAWMIRKSEGIIRPWNFDEMVDLDKSEVEFIKRMTCRCTYLAGEDVLAKNSLLYCKYTVLNEINNITVDGKKISVAAKQKIYNEQFMKKRRVTVKMIGNLLHSCGEMTSEQKLGGIDLTIRSSLKSYHDFKSMLERKVLCESDVEKIIERITVTTDITRLKSWLKQEYPSISAEDVKYISKLNYKDYGRLSRRLLENVYETDTNTGEVVNEGNIITRLWETNDNLMQLLSSKYKYMERIKALNKEYYSDPKHSLTISDRLKEMYVPTAVRRSINRTLDVVNEIKSIAGKDPDKIFIEMARENDMTKKGVRTKSRREQIKTLFEDAKKLSDMSAEIAHLEEKLSETDDGKLRSEKYYLYFTQLGRCMYTGHPIDFEKLGGDTYYNIDHIFPQAKIKDDSLENKVLVESEANGTKSDTYPIDKDIRDKMRGFWKSLHEKKLIGDKKLQRLIRSTPFSEDELAGFISRQLVETRQSTKAAAELLKELCPESEIVYVKAELASDFRHETDMLKCREINDLHHAKDAYLNIVMGNVYNAKFTKDPLNFIRSGEHYSLKMFKKNADGKTSGLLTHKVERNGTTVWDPAKSFDTVRKMMSKNSVRYVRYTYKRKGGLFNQMPESKKPGLIQRKKGLKTEKYGGYNNASVSTFGIIKCKNDIVIIPIEIMKEYKFFSDNIFAKQYALEKLENIYPQKKYQSLTCEDIIVPCIHYQDGSKRLPILKINSLLEVNGFRINLCSKDSGGKYMIVSGAESLICSYQDEKYIKSVCSYAAKTIDEKSLQYNGISYERNLDIYDLICQKCANGHFSKWKKFRDTSIVLNKKRDIFISLSLNEQICALKEIVNILKSGRSVYCDLSAIEESKQSCISKLGAVLTSIKSVSDIRIIDQSPTGLYEKKSVNLLEL